MSHGTILSETTNTAYMKKIIFIWNSCIVLAAFCCQAVAQNISPDSLLNKAHQLLTNAQYDSAIAVYQHCFDVATATKDSLYIGNALMGIGVANDDGGRFNKALEYYFKALRIFEKTGNQIRAGGALKNIGNTYRTLGAFEKAHSYLRNALIVQKDSTRIPKILNDIGSVYLDQDSTIKARWFFQQAISGYNRHIIDETKAYIFNNLAITYLNEQQYPKALAYYQRALALMQKINYRYGIALILDNIGELYYKTGNYTRALEYHLRNHDSIQLIKANDLLLSSFSNLALTYVSLGNYKKAYTFLVEEMKLKDTLYKEESRKSYAEMEAKYQNEKKQTEILLLQQNNKITQIELTSQRRAKYLLLIVIGLIFIITISLYKSYTSRKKANKALNRLNDQLTVANSSKTKLISIISHDLRSPVSSLFHFLQLQKIQAEKTEQKDQTAFNSKISQSAENLLEAMEDLLIWSKTQMDHFKPAMETINTAELLDEIIHLHEQFAANKSISLIKEPVAGLEFDTDLNFVKIILRNLTSNAIKFTPIHGVITLSASQQDNNILLTVKDNGQGISPADMKTIFEWNSIRSDSSGLGLKLAKEFTEKLGGKLSVVSEPGHGATFVVCLPLEHDVKARS